MELFDALVLHHYVYSTWHFTELSHEHVLVPGSTTGRADAK